MFLMFPLGIAYFVFFVVTLAVGAKIGDRSVMLQATVPPSRAVGGRRGGSFWYISEGQDVV